MIKQHPFSILEISGYCQLKFLPAWALLSPDLDGHEQFESKSQELFNFLQG
jgi:hypothetical protein